MNVKLTIVPVAGWNRENLLHSSERPWIAPSPALVEISQVGLYVMWGTLENFNLAVGRGSTNELAFKVLGAPWITIDESASLAKNLNALRFKNISFTPFSWKVTRAEYEGQIAFGVKVLWNGEEVRTDECTYKVAQVLIKMFSDRLNVSSLSPASLGSKSMLEAIKRQVPWPVYQKIIDQEITAFRFRRKPYLLY